MEINMTLTEWFEPRTKPTRVGVYEVRWDESFPEYRYWNGVFWCAGSDTVSKAANRSNIEVLYQSVKWRGLAKDPNL